MSNFHPDLDLLMEYAAGSLAFAPAACVAIHIHHCTRCQRIAGELTEVGANFFEALAPFAVSDVDLLAVLEKLDELPSPVSSDNRATPDSTAAILQRLMHGDFSGLEWKNLSDKLRLRYLPTGDPRYEFSIYHMRAGGRIPQHDHRGTEITLVLEGGFTIDGRAYQKGDFLVSKPGNVHAIEALPSEECYCLLILDAPLKFTEWRYRWMNPFLKLEVR